MRKILTVTLNPTVDLSTSTPHVRPGEKLRCAPPVADPGGGGVNVSRAINNLGGQSRAFVASGGSVGHRLEGLLHEERVPVVPFHIKGQSRQCIAVTDEETGQQYRFVMPGPDWSEDLTQKAIDAIVAEASADEIVVVSGSMPPGVPDDFPARLNSALVPAGVTLIADTSGGPLRHLIDEPCHLAILRMDAAEAEFLAGRSLANRGETADFAAQLVAAGVAGVVIIARGADGNTLVAGTRRLHASRAIEKVVSAVGAGDSFVGGFALALSKGMTLEDALRHGTAAASAAILTEATDLCRREDAERLLPGCELFEI